MEAEPVGLADHVEDPDISGAVGIFSATLGGRAAK
jgi:hypothetical protein